MEDVSALRASLAEPERFEAVFDRHHGAVWRFLASRGGRDVADELAGEVFVVAFRRRETYDSSRGSVRSWLFGIAENLLRTRRRSESRRRRAVERLTVVRERDAGVFDAVDDAAADGARLRAVACGIERLAPADREVVVLYAFEERSYAEIAARLGIPVGTVRSRLARARRRLGELVDTSGEVMTTEPEREGTTGA